MLAAEEFRIAGHHGAGNLLDLARLAVYWYWCRLAWLSSLNVRHRLWTHLAKGALAAGLVVTVLV